MARIARDVTWLIGRTPMVELAQISPEGCRIVAKLEAMNPTSSNKDRAALGMIEHAESTGLLKPGGTLVECTSGDLGLALAMVGRQRGYHVILTMPEGTPEHRRSLLKALKAELITTPRADGMAGAMAKADEITRSTDGAVCLQAFTNRANSRIHTDTTAREIWEDTDGTVSTVILPVGTGGTAAGCAAFLRQRSVRLIGVEPVGSPVLSGGQPGRHDIPGLGAGFIPDILKTSDLDEVITVSDEQTHDAVLFLAQQEAILVGPASGAVLYAAMEVAQRAESQGQLMVALLPDSGERYFDHDSYRQED